MNKDLTIAWVSGLFEGEGSFNIGKECLTKGVTIPSTDLDVLEKVQKYFGGKIYKQKEIRNPKWKTVWVWKLNKFDSIEFIKNIQPYLCTRRYKRSIDYFQIFENEKQKKELEKIRLVSIKKEIFKLRNEGKKHREIAEIVGYERSHITKILNGSVSVVETQ